MTKGMFSFLYYICIVNTELQITENECQVSHFNTLNYSINLYYSSLILETNCFFVSK